jgi:hypothetical protein
MRRADLVADCDRCVALCCVAPSLHVSDDFAVEKPAGVPCPFLAAACRCSIHDVLAERGFPGCAIYDCYGAGPRATRACADADPAMQHAVFLALRDVHEWLWLLTEAARLVPGDRLDLAEDLAAEIALLDAAVADPVARVLEGHQRARRPAVEALLRRVGEAVGGRAGLPRPPTTDPCGTPDA